MTVIEDFFNQAGPLYGALLATVFTWSVTAAGASLVFFFKGLNQRPLDSFSIENHVI
jgi:ZIP family zinc transporter